MKKITIGTEITLYLNEDSYEFCNEYRAREILMKYCSFMPVEIYLENATAKPEYETIPVEGVKETDKVIERIMEEAKTEEQENEDGDQRNRRRSLRPVRCAKIRETSGFRSMTPLRCGPSIPMSVPEEEYKEFYSKGILRL